MHHHHHRRIVTEVVATTDCNAMHHGLTTQYPGGIVARSRLRAPRFLVFRRKRRRRASQIIMVLLACPLDNCFSGQTLCCGYTAAHNGSRPCRASFDLFYFYATFGLRGLGSRTTPKPKSILRCDNSSPID